MLTNRVKKTTLPVPDSFRFPFEPYTIQVDFMRHLFEAIELRKLAIFESPTGTGKTLSIICGALRWLHENEARDRSYFDELIRDFDHLIVECEQDEQDTATDWISIQSKKNQLKYERNEIKLTIEQLKRNEDLLMKIRSKYRSGQKSQLVRTTAIGTDSVPDNCEDDDHDLIICETHTENSDDDDNDDEDANNDTDIDDRLRPVQLLICSRTHSQISQFVRELKRSPFADSVRVTVLASRQNYCVNDPVRKLSHVNLINERCCDLVSGHLTTTGVRAPKKLKKPATCAYLANTDEIHDRIVSEIHDIESLVSAAQKSHGCPYYASKKAARNVQVILMPYNYLLHRATRVANEIRLKNNIVIIDEAHNLLEALESMYNCEISHESLTESGQQLATYKEMFLKRFATKTLINLNQVILLVQRIEHLLAAPNSLPNVSFAIRDFLYAANIEEFNLYAILEFTKKTKLAQKLHRYRLRYASGESTAALSNPLIHVQNFLEALTNRDEDCRVLVNRCDQNRTVLKFQVMNCDRFFDEIRTEARAVILAGGTMKPYDEFQKRLFRANVDRHYVFACKHVVAKENLICVALGTGPSGQSLRFAYDVRESRETVLEFGRLLTNLCNVIPAGIVCFFTSYAYETFVYETLAAAHVLDTIGKKKFLIREPKDARNCETVLRTYAARIEQSAQTNGSGRTGAVLFSVAGGKLSEGLNFNDDLGRCVIMVGMPYANIKSIELSEKMSYLNRTFGTAGECGGQAYYENACMRIVNQCIGRAIRHANDYACLVLVDERYRLKRVQQALPDWILDSMESCDRFGPAFAKINRFFHAKQNRA